MKKIIILMLALLMSACSAVKPAETLSSMQTEPTAETTVTETAASEETTEPIPKKTEPVIETPKEEPSAPIIIERPEQNPVPNTTTITTAESSAEPIITETTAEPPTTPKTPAEAAEAEKTAEIPETVETPPESVTEPPKAEFRALPLEEQNKNFIQAALFALSRCLPFEGENKEIYQSGLVLNLPDAYQRGEIFSKSFIKIEFSCSIPWEEKNIFEKTLYFSRSRALPLEGIFRKFRKPFIKSAFSCSTT